MTNQPYVFMTDSDSDLPFNLADAKNITVVKMPYVMDGQEYFDENGREGEDKQKAFFDRMRQGAAPSTACLSTPIYLEYFEPILASGKDILFISFSGQMSATLNFVYEARSELMDKYPERKITVVDTLSISGPMTLLLMGAHTLYENGCTMDEIEQWLRDNRLKAQAFFTVDDLKYLRRGGRISAVSAVFGTMLDIKPIICMSKAGKLEAAEKAQGRKKAIRTLVERTVENIENPENQELIILHGDCREEADRLEAQLRSRIPNVGGIRVQMIGPVIGAHCGPGTLAVCFMGKERTH